VEGKGALERENKKRESGEVQIERGICEEGKGVVREIGESLGRIVKEHR